MFRATGRGKFEVNLDFSGVGVLKALLYNFDFDDFADFKYRELKVEHTKFLGERVVPLLADDVGNIWMQGSASRIGPNAWNMELSKNRVGRIASYLGVQGITTEQMRLDAVGEELAAKHSEDDERDRSVTLWILPRLEFDSPPPRRVPNRPKTTRHFKISMVTGLSLSHALNAGRLLKRFKGVKLGGGPAFDGNFFLVWDTKNNISCLYLYVGVGLGAGLSVTPKVSATTHGPWTDFTTEKPISCWQFGRWARFTSIGVGSTSVNWISLETPRGVDNVDSLRIATGTTLGAGASTTIGDFIRVDQPRRFSGP